MTSWTRRITAIAAASALAVGVAACGDDNSSSSTGAGDGTTVKIADKQFTESAIVAQAYAAGLRTQGFDAQVSSLASTELADKAVRDGAIDVYPEYDGTSYLTVLKKTADAAPDSRDALFDEVTSAYAGRGLTALPPAPYNNGNEVACTDDAVAADNITDLTALGKASPKLVYSANAEHLTREDGLPLLRKDYGVNFKKVITVDIALRYTPIADGKAQCVYAFGTDPQLAQLPLQLIKDDKGSFSGKVPFRTFPVVNTQWLDGLSADAKTAFTDTLDAVSAGLTQDKIQELNAAVDLDKEDPEVVAQSYVDSLGLGSK